MYKLITVAGTAAVLLGIVPHAYAQSVAANSAASLQGVQSRSIQLQPGSNTSGSTIQSSNTQALQPGSVVNAVRNSNPATNQVIYDQLSDEANLIISPVKEDRELFDSSSAGVTGNNRIQVLYQPNE